MSGHLVVDDVRVSYSVGGGRRLVAVDGVSFDLGAGEILGLVGESGCGKSTLARALVGLERPFSGRIALDGEDLLALKGARRRAARRRIQLVFQDPESSLSPRLTIGQTLEEPLRVAGMRSRRARVTRVGELLELVGLPAAVAARRPRALSGGQRQRIGIARALACEPDVLVCDEPVSSLDASVRAQVMNALLDLRAELGLSCLLIAHDLGLVHQACDRIAVMYMGRVVEHGPSHDVYATPRHPYARALLAAVPPADPDLARAAPSAMLAGEVPSPLDTPSGCRFHTRCPLAEGRCVRQEPELTGAAHAASCHVLG